MVVEIVMLGENKDSKSQFRPNLAEKVTTTMPSLKNVLMFIEREVLYT